MESVWGGAGEEMESGLRSLLASYVRLNKCQELNVEHQLHGVIGLVI